MRAQDYELDPEKRAYSTRARAHYGKTCEELDKIFFEEARVSLNSGSRSRARGVSRL